VVVELAETADAAADGSAARHPSAPADERAEAAAPADAQPHPRASDIAANPPSPAAPPEDTATDSATTAAATTGSVVPVGAPTVPSTDDSAFDSPSDSALAAPRPEAEPSSEDTATDAAGVTNSTTAADEPGGAASEPRAALAIHGEPARFSTQQPLGVFLLALAQRDFAAADSTLQALRVNQALGLPEAKLREAELIRDALDQFWHAVDEAQAALQPGDTLWLRGVACKVLQYNAKSLSLQSSQSPSGQAESFDLRRSNLQRDLAIALLLRRYAASPAAGWRLISIFLAIDREGDVQRAEYYARKAELHGFAAGGLIELIRDLGGLPEPEPMSPPDASPALSTSLADDEAAGDDDQVAADALPEKDQQQQARREVLAPLYAELREQSVPNEQWASEILRRAESDELTEAARYVLLDSALKRARSRRDIDTALAAIDQLAQRFGQNRADLRYDLLQTVSGRSKGDERQRLAQLSRKFAADAVVVDDYPQAVRFAALAQSIGRSLTDQMFRRSLVDFRLEIDAIQKQYQTLPVADASGSEAAAAVTLRRARFRVLAKGDFEGGLSDLKACDDQTLRGLVERELARPQTPAQQRSLAQDWLRFGRTLSELEQANAVRRARYWYQACLPGLDRAQRIDVQRDWDAITAILGRDSNRMDLTELTPLDARVGFGSLGINRNPDAANNPKVQPLPQVGGSTIRRFIWACAPSRVEYLVPEGANGVEATAQLNAASMDGVRFIVKANGQALFTGPVLKTMGDQLPIRVELPAGTQTLELIVEPLHNTVLDHAYWIAPQLHFGS
jgi:hypothetical protein